jgi:hypothetical protein
MGAMFAVLLAVEALQTDQDDASRRVKVLIEQLHSDDVQERSQAAQSLRTLGVKAVEELQKAAKEKGSDISHAANDLLDDILCRTPDRALRRIEETLLTSSTVAVKFRSQSAQTANDGEQTSHTQGKIILSQGNRVSVTVETEYKQGTSTSKGNMALLSDGKNLAIKADSERHTSSPKSLRENLTILLVRLGWWETGWLLAAQTEEYRIEDEFAFTDLRFGDKGDHYRSITYTVKSKRLKDLSIEVALFYDPDTYVLLRRTGTSKGNVGGHEIMSTKKEFFDSVSLDEKLPKDTFKLPGSK